MAQKIYVIPIFFITGVCPYAGLMFEMTNK